MVAIAPDLLRPEQHRALDAVRSQNGRTGLWMEMGTGKTRVGLAAREELECARTLVVCPLSVVGVWEREAEKIGLTTPMYDLTNGSLAERARKMRALAQGHKPGIVLVNYESYWRQALRDEILRWQPDSVILDEAHRIRRRTSRQSRFAHQLADRDFVKVRLALSGTPITNGLQDAWSLYRFINTRVFGSRWKDFESKYLVLGGYMGKALMGYKNEDDAKQRIADNSFQCPKDLSTLPERFDIPYPVRLEMPTWAAYEELRKRAIVEINDMAGQPQTVIARIVLTLLLRLQQITGGFATSIGEEPIDISDEKARASVELVETAIAEGERVVIFCRFRHDLDLLQAKLRAAGIDAVDRIDGEHTGAQRKATLAAFAAGETNVLLAQIKTASEGIDLTAASTAIFFSVGFSFDQFMQAKDRLHRQGQTRPVTYYHLLATSPTGGQTVDWKVYAALQAKLQIAQRVTSLVYVESLFTP